jgi:thioredoxin reductase (NADPH)
MPEFDVAIIGGGPAGTHAAFKAALLYRTVVLFDKGRKFSRIFWSPRVDNLPGRFGEAGRDIVATGYASISEYEADVGRQFVTIHENTDVTKVNHLEGGFQLSAMGKDGNKSVTAKVVILATGCADSQPQLRDFRKRDIEAILPYANKGLADYCLLCDGHTVEGKKVAIIGCDPGSRGIAKSLKANFGAKTTIIPYCNVREEGTKGPANPREPWEAVEEDLAKSKIPILYGNIKELTGIKDGKFGIVFEDGTTHFFDKAWISMGWYQVNNQAAKDLGGQLDNAGFVVTDADGRVQDAGGKTIPGFYCIGDVRANSWKQIPIAWGQAEAAVVDAFVSKPA